MKQIFVAAAMVLMAASCDSLPSAQTSTQTAGGVESTPISTDISTFPFAYVDIDRTLVGSEIYKREGQPLQQRIESAQRDWAQKEQQFQTEIVKLNDRYQNGLITTANAQLEQQRIEQRVEAFQIAMQQQAAVLDEENAVFTNRTQVLMRDAVKQINGDGRYKMIFNATSLIDADTMLNISTQVIEALDRLYLAEQTK